MSSTLQSQMGKICDVKKLFFKAAEVISKKDAHGLLKTFSKALRKKNPGIPKGRWRAKLKMFMKIFMYVMNCTSLSLHFWTSLPLPVSRKSYISLLCYFIHTGSTSRTEKMPF